MENEKLKVVTWSTDVYNKKSLIVSESEQDQEDMDRIWEKVFDILLRLENMTIKEKVLSFFKKIAKAIKGE